MARLRPGLDRVHSLFLAVTTERWRCAFCGRRGLRRFYTARKVFSICDDCVRALAKDLAQQPLPSERK
jgi:hypothetical protein